jgi:hypothetical protein
LFANKETYTVVVVNIVIDVLHFPGDAVARVGVWVSLFEARQRRQSDTQSNAA